MKKIYREAHYDRRIYFSLVIIYLLFTLSIGFLGLEFLNSQYTHRLNLLANITGTVLSEDPALENVLVEAIQDSEYQHLTEGYTALHKYGYQAYLSMYDDIQYRHSLKGFLALALLFFLASLLIVTFCFHLLFRNRNMQEKRLLSILDRFLSEDYSFMEHSGDMTPIFNQSFTDTLVKLGHKLMLKTQALSAEHDNTKTLVTDISHQLKTPVSALKNCLTLSMEADSATERDTFLQRCSLQLSKLESLLEALIHISRLETSMITLHREQTALSDILIDAVNTIYVKAMQKDISVEVIDSCEESSGNPDTSLSLSLDRKWTAEALANILDNAVKYSPLGSTVTVRLHKLYSYVRIEIEDAGIGIPKEDYNKIFQRFYRGFHPTVQQSEGSGVGLYLSRKILEEQGGSIMVKPAFRQGSIFVIQLPLDYAAHTSDAAAAPTYSS